MPYLNHRLDIHPLTHPKTIGRGGGGGGGGGGGAGLLLSPKWFYQVLALEPLARSAFDLHAVAVTLPIQLFVVVIYGPPGPVWDFYEVRLG